MQSIRDAQLKHWWWINSTLLNPMWMHCRLRQLLLVSLICDSGGLPQSHPFEIIIEILLMFVRDHSFWRSQPIDEHEGPSFSANIQHKWTIPSQKLLPRPLGSWLACCLCSTWHTQATGCSKWCALCFVLVGKFYYHKHTKNHTASWLEGKIKSNNDNVFSFNDTVL